jgi:hypothetical protein
MAGDNIVALNDGKAPSNQHVSRPCLQTVRFWPKVLLQGKMERLRCTSIASTSAASSKVIRAR